MRILVACDSFKESCSAPVVCECIAQGIVAAKRTWEVARCPLADGGEGTLQVIAAAMPVQVESVPVLGPLGAPVLAEIGWFDVERLRERSLIPLATMCDSGPAALIEAAHCIGIALVPPERRDPKVASSYGLGQAIRRAESQGAVLVIVSLGGTCTVDAGLGMTQALGALVRGVPVPSGGGELASVSEIDLEAFANHRACHETWIVTDVSNPLLGPRGAARAFGPQKGATAEIVEELERGIAHYAGVLFATRTKLAATGFRETSSSLEAAIAASGSGAAGGIGFALRQLYGATTLPGIDFVMRCVGFNEALARADLVITGEGRLDETSFEGKVLSGVIARAQERGIPVDVVCGAVAADRNDLCARGIRHLEVLTDHARNAEDAKRRVRELLTMVGQRLASR